MGDKSVSSDRKKALYETELNALCYCMAYLSRYAEMAKWGEVIETGGLQGIMEKAKSVRKSYEKAREELGFAADYGFTQDSLFAGYDGSGKGFAILHGNMEGDRSLVKGTVEKWIREFFDMPVSEGTLYRFEVARYALMLAGGVDEVDELMKEKRKGRFRGKEEKNEGRIHTVRHRGRRDRDIFPERIFKVFKREQKGAG